MLRVCDLTVLNERYSSMSDLALGQVGREQPQDLELALAEPFVGSTSPTA